MLKKIVSVSAIAMGVATLPLNSTFAFNAFKINTLQFEGLGHLSQSTVLNSIGPLKNTLFNTQKSDQLINTLFKTGFFSDVSLYQQGKHTLQIVVKERPVIAAVDITGNNAIKTKALDKVLARIGLSIGNMYNPVLLTQMIQSLKNQYYILGKYSVIVTPKVIQLSRNRVKINIKISEGRYTHIQNINITGNHAFSESKLKDELTLSPPGLFSFFTKDDVYSPIKLQASLEKLSNFYLDHGYLKFKVLSSEVSLSPFKNKTSLTLNISEGHQYKLSKISFMGKTPLKNTQIQSIINQNLKTGEIFSRQNIVNTIQAIQSALGNLGYAFAEIKPVPDINSKNHTVSIKFLIRLGQRVYINEINFSGNVVTNDRALRKYLRYQEAGVYNSKAMHQSLMSLKRLPYLESVKQQIEPIPGKPGQVNINYALKERSASSFTGSIGYSQVDKLLLGLSTSMPNVLGTGKSFSIGTQISKPYKSINISYTNPFFTLSGISQTMRFYLTRVDNADRDLVDYSTNTIGANLSYGIPINATDYFHFGAGVNNTKLLQPQNDTSETVADFVNAHGDSYNALTLSMGWSRNSTNSAFFPTQGIDANLGASASTPLSTFEWYKLSSGITWYTPVTSSITLSLGGNIDFGDGYGKTHNLPFYNNFYGGGWGSVRGFTQGTMGPRDTLKTPVSGHPGQFTYSAGQALGGNLLVDASANIYFPVPFEGVSSSYRLGAFLDMGNVYDTYNLSSVYNHENNARYPDLNNLRYSVGVSFEWLSPLGPLDFSLAKPLNAKPGDQTSPFQFTIGGVF